MVHVMDAVIVGNSLIQHWGANAPGIDPVKQQQQSLPQAQLQQVSIIDLHPVPSPTHSTPFPNPRHHLMILRIRRLFI